MFLCIVSALHQPGPKGKVYLVTVQKQKLISQCLIVTQIQHTTIRQSKIPLSKLCLLLHIYCTKVLVAKLYYSTYICQLWSGDSKQMSDKAIKGLTDGVRTTWIWDMICNWCDRCLSAEQHIGPMNDPVFRDLQFLTHCRQNWKKLVLQYLLGYCSSPIT